MKIILDVLLAFRVGGEAGRICNVGFIYSSVVRTENAVGEKFKLDKRKQPA